MYFLLGAGVIILYLIWLELGSISYGLLEIRNVLERRK
jgi:hypothetical protein